VRWCLVPVEGGALLGGVGAQCAGRSEMPHFVLFGGSGVVKGVVECPGFGWLPPP
jgi:hypothetical protein